MTTAATVLSELKKLGKESFRKAYRRHGASENLFGVSTADLKSLQKKLKSSAGIAPELWESGNYDARILATMIADPSQANHAQLDSWAAGLDCYPVADAFAAYAAKTPMALEKADVWSKSKNDWLGSAAWHLIGQLTKDADLPDSFFEERLQAISKSIGKAGNRTRHAMNNALIAIGIRSKGLEKKAIAAARAIGPVEVDHGDTACVTPDAESYIVKVGARRG